MLVNWRVASINKYEFYEVKRVYLD